ncbi:hypothetical protein ACQUY5_32085 [Bacillus cereus]|uniref:hypothetical protein n=1 Tax=Bacillus cereus TaxID=1396 RepID=UPI003D16E993
MIKLGEKKRYRVTDKRNGEEFIVQTSLRDGKVVAGWVSPNDKQVEMKTYNWHEANRFVNTGIWTIVEELMLHAC